MQCLQMGDHMSTLGIDGDYLYGLDMPGADGYFLAIKVIIVLIVLLIAVWMLYPRCRSCR
jgi:hypothetical protein